MDEIIFIIIMAAGLGYSLFRSLKETPKPDWKSVKQNLFHSTH
ncbi:hypothetical protein [Guptibacillus hwajinpoensis]|uniref:Phage protein n=1 Tax=Guptibacillus hwajinpoensis TaxID=208199 RepID=A0ABU0K4J8_9BACL|nr:hypothetical protein [Alkalihalobacillus hemicentroti]MDQ0484291.1 hypothetical protein [Alkalihalobacillus hemicentroti]